jgi:hypothetical protein
MSQVGFFFFCSLLFIQHLKVRFSGVFPANASQALTTCYILLPINPKAEKFAIFLAFTPIFSLFLPYVGQELSGGMYE